MRTQIKLSTLSLLSLTSLNIIAQSKQPNIVFILADDLRGGTVGQYKQEDIKTPNLDQLSKDGVSFNNAYIMGGTNGAVSMPSRAMLLTGRNLFGLSNQGAVLPNDNITLGETLQKVGYETYAIGKWHSDKASFNRTFSNGDEIFFGGMHDQWNVPLYHYDITGTYPDKLAYIDDFYHTNVVKYTAGDHKYPGKHSTEIFGDAAVNYLEKKDGSKPFFLYVALMSPHDPRTMPEEYLHLYDTAKISVPKNFVTSPMDIGELDIRDEVLASFPRKQSEIKTHIRDYYAMITHIDDQIGKIIRELKEKGLYDNTIFIFTSDNGLALGQHGLLGKQNLFQPSLNVPFIIAGPSIPKNQQSLANCYLFDIYPTLCSLLNIEVPSSVQGLNFAPSIFDPKLPARSTMFYGYKLFQRALKSDNLKLIEYNVKGVQTTQLFDIVKDPMETTDLSNDPKMKKRLNQIQKALVLESKNLGDSFFNE